MVTERKVGQHDSDIHEIYRLLEALKRDGSDQRAMITRQANRLDSLEANVAQLAEDMVEIKADVSDVKDDVSELKADMAELKELVSRVLALVRGQS
jgi:septal ring factor EnvC (AmiA/AmiB activator)